MSCDYQNGSLHLDQVDLAQVAQAFGTPTYVYSSDMLCAQWRAYNEAFGERAHRVCYAVKANDNLSILQALHRTGASFDIVSGGELARVLEIGANSSDVVFSGVGKTSAEIEYAVINGVGCINLESTDELERVAAIAAAAGRVVDVAVRVNPDVDARTHPYISTGLKENKFGIPIDQARAMYQRIAAHGALKASGIACHIGSQLVSIEPVKDAVKEVVQLADVLASDGIELDHIDVGGGLGISYCDEKPPSAAALVTAMCELVPSRYTIVMEPGRSIVGPAGVLVTRVEYVKHTASKNFVIVDAAMNDLMRPALYEAWHDVKTVRETSKHPGLRSDVVGPVCESGDWLARDRELALEAGDLIALTHTGAYGFVMASNYNSRPRPAEVLVEGHSFRLIRERESIADMLANERKWLSGNTH